MSSEEPDLPVAFTFTLDPEYEQGIKWNNKPNPDHVTHNLEEGDELVKKSDAEEAIKEARQAGRQEILNSIRNFLKLELRQLEITREMPMSDSRYDEGRVDQLQELRQKLEEEVEEH